MMASLLGQWSFGRPGAYWIPAAMPWLRLGETIYHPAPRLDAMRFQRSRRLWGPSRFDSHSR